MALAHKPIVELKQQRHLISARRARKAEAERRVVGPLGRRLVENLQPENIAAAFGAESLSQCNTEVEAR